MNLANNRFLKFLLAGGLAASLNFGSRFAFSLYMSFEYAVVCAFFVGLSSGFVLHKYFVFEPSAKSVKTEMSAYFAVNMLALAQTWLVTMLLAWLLVPKLGVQQGEAMSHLCGILVPVITSYFGHKYYTFKSEESTQ